MEYRRLGRSGLKLSSLVLGTMNFGSPTSEKASRSILEAAFEAGVNCIDCADVYAGGKSEQILGNSLKAMGARKEVILTTKVFWPTGEGPNDRGLSRAHILDSCEKSLRNLKTDHIDLYFLHRADFQVPLEETLSAMDLLVRQGKVRYLGCSTFPPWKTVEALWVADRYGYPVIVCEQPPYNLLDRRFENEILPMCRAFDLGVITWSPLAQGVLAGRYADAGALPPGSRGSQKKIFAERITREGIEAARKLALRAEEKGCSPAQFATAWVLHQPGVTATLVGPRTLNHLKESLKSCSLELDPSDLAFCDALVAPGTHLSDHFNTAKWNPLRESEL